MAKKSKKNKRASSNPADSLRDAVERTWQGASGNASKRVTDVFDEFGSALVRLRETLDERRVLDTLETLRDEVQNLGRRVGMLEGEPATSAAKPSAAKRKPSARKRKAAAKRKPAAKRAPAKRKAAAKRKPAASASKRKPAARKTAAAKKPAAAKAAAKPAASSS